MSLTESAQLTLRRATPADAGAVAATFTASRAAAVPAIPAPIHTAAEDRAFWAGRVESSEVWVAQPADAASVAGFADLESAWLHSLYVHPAWARQGVGTALLDLAKGLRPAGFALWVFTSNQPARDFYAHAGLIELEQTDGSGNEEQSPDVRMAWPGADPMAYFRAQIDEVDADLAALLARRAALTAAVQPLKEVGGHPGRDHSRERRIARDMAQRAPSLSEDTWLRLVQAVISISLDAAEE